MKQNKFKILIASYNNEDWVEYNLASVLNQTYTNYKVIYVDDCSTDSTYDKVMEIVGDNEQFTVIRREENVGGTYNHISFFSSLEDDEILVLIEGDDWFFDEQVLENLNKSYNEHDYWMTYGRFFVYDGTSDVITEANPQNTAYPDFIHKHKLYRRDTWRASHLRTYKGFLVKAIDLQDFTSPINNKLYNHAADLALAFPCLEMCPPDKIGVVKFGTHVYNATPRNRERTKEREQNIDNQIFEIEIRSKKKYKQGLTGEKLPQINVFGDYAERHNIPNKFSYIYNQEVGEYDMVLLQDDNIVTYVNAQYCKANGYSSPNIALSNIPDNIPVVARIAENRKFFNQATVVECVLANYDKFEQILTWDEELLKLPNAKFCPVTDLSQFNTLPVELELSELQIFEKSKNISCITSNKAFFPGHRVRLDIVEKTKHKYDLFGRGFKEIPSKLDALRDYRFSVVIENDVSNNYFTEKINDCFLTGTVPIYYGCPNIGDFFNTDGIITFKDHQELLQILDNLTEDDYINRIVAIRDNHERAKQMPLTNDMNYSLYYEPLIKQ